MRGGRLGTRFSIGAWQLWRAGEEQGILGQSPLTGVLRRASELMTAALYADDAEAAGVNARELLGQPDKAVDLLGGPRCLPAARHAVIQRFGGVGALLVIGCEEEAMREATGETEHGVIHVRLGRRSKQQVGQLLSRLLREFGQLSAEEMDELVESVERADGARDLTEAARARRWLHVTYAVAARDGTDEAHHEYVRALDSTLSYTRRLVAI